MIIVLPVHHMTMFYCHLAMWLWNFISSCVSCFRPLRMFTLKWPLQPGVYRWLHIQNISEKAPLSFGSVHMQEHWLFECKQRHILFTMTGKTSEFAGHHHASFVFLFVLVVFTVCARTHMFKHTSTVIKRTVVQWGTVKGWLHKVSLRVNEGQQWDTSLSLSVCAASE